ncbi:hypothetical protein Plec18167_006105 [Paecilomyces lecythidis]|uniref:ER-bound oxygenase mpaB/mpaB'/Rubber oxygenase catalytic domain-containing protein n=1 Tax=Paecilomyces lecythidis TaxID=3004212 RepID=A0ABR3XES7_9EURO
MTSKEKDTEAATANIQEKEKEIGDSQGSSSESETTASRPDLLNALKHLREIPDVLQEGILFAGGGPAILLQAAVPNILKERQGGDRLAIQLLESVQTIISYICCLALGTKKEKKALLELLDKETCPLKENDHYSQDPAVRLWVAATLYATATDIYQRVYGKMDYRTAQRAYAEYSIIVSALKVPDDVWPRSREAFWQYWDKMIEDIDSSSLPKDLEPELVHNFQKLPRWVRPFKPILRAFTKEMLPPHIREGYGLKSTASCRAIYQFGLWAVIAIYPAFPKKLRSYPQRYYQRKLEEKLK